MWYIIYNGALYFCLSLSPSLSLFSLSDMAVQNVIGDSFRGATWVALHNGGGVGW